MTLTLKYRTSRQSSAAFRFTDSGLTTFSGLTLTVKGRNEAG